MSDTIRSIERRDMVLRGGSWIRYAGHCRLAFRHADHPGGRVGSFGFRVALRGRGSNERHKRIN